MISFGKRTKHKTFGYIPRFYNPDKEALEHRLKQYKNITDEDLAKERIKMGFKNNYIGVNKDIRSQYKKKANLRLLYIIVVLLFVTYFIMTSDRLLRMLEAFQ